MNMNRKHYVMGIELLQVTVENQDVPRHLKVGLQALAECLEAVVGRVTSVPAKAWGYSEHRKTMP